MTIKVTGISEKNTIRHENYLMLGIEDSFTAIKKAIEYADREYTCEYDENLKPILNSVYKEIVKITKIEVVDD